MAGRDAMDGLGRLDILVNNAGIIRREDSAAFSEKDWDDVMDVNLGPTKGDPVENFVWLAQTVHAYPTWSMGIQKTAAQFFFPSEGREARRHRQRTSETACHECALPRAGGGPPPR